MTVRVSHPSDILWRSLRSLQIGRRLRPVLLSLLHMRNDRGGFWSSNRFRFSRGGIGARHGQRSEEVIFRVRTGRRRGCAGRRGGREAEPGSGEAQAR